MKATKKKISKPTKMQVQEAANIESCRPVFLGRKGPRLRRLDGESWRAGDGRLKQRRCVEARGEHDPVCEARNTNNHKATEIECSIQSNCNKEGETKQDLKKKATEKTEEMR